MALDAQKKTSKAAAPETKKEGVKSEFPAEVEADVLSQTFDFDVKSN
jgi:hypothetical protein